MSKPTAEDMLGSSARRAQRRLNTALARMDKPQGYLEVDTAEDAVFSLEAAARFLEYVTVDGQWWKWVIVALHSSVQGSLALALEGGNAFLVQKRGVRERILVAHDQGLPPPEQHMDNFLKLLKRVEEPGALRAGTISFDDKEREEVTRLDELRDSFVHFNCKSWLVEHRLMARCVVGCCAAAEKLFNCESIIWHNAAHPARITTALLAVHAGAASHAS